MNKLDTGKYFISEGHVFLANMPMEFNAAKAIHVLPFLVVSFDNWTGETKGPSISPFIKSYKAKLYTKFPIEIYKKVTDINNRTQTEKYIRPVLEIYFLSYSLVYQEAIQFLFHNTASLPKLNVPKDVEPLVVEELDDDFINYMFSDEVYIKDGINLYKRLGVGPLEEREDLSWQRFTLVKGGGFGALIGRLIDPNNMNVFFSLIAKLSQNIKINSSNVALVKSLDFLRRALVLEKNNFFNEAFLNYFRIIEAFVGNYSEKAILKYFEMYSEITQDELKKFYATRAEVTAHGSGRMNHFREVGQLEFHQVKKIAISLIYNHLN